MRSVGAGERLGWREALDWAIRIESALGIYAKPVEEAARLPRVGKWEKGAAKELAKFLLAVAGCFAWWWLVGVFVRVFFGGFRG